MDRIFFWLLKPIVIVLLAVPVSASSTCPPDTLAWTETRLFFGRDIGDVGEVSQEQWRDFTVAEIIPRFGDGFTVLDGAGYWKGASCKAVLVDGGCEKSKILLVQYPPSSDLGTGADAKLNAIAAAYIKQFNQEAVMRSDTPVCTQFITRDQKADQKADQKGDRK